MENDLLWDSVYKRDIFKEYIEKLASMVILIL